MDTVSSLIPILILSIPESSVTTVILSSLLAHGLRPKPKFMSEYGDLSNAPRL